MCKRVYAIVAMVTVISFGFAQMFDPQIDFNLSNDTEYHDADLTFTVTQVDQEYEINSFSITPSYPGFDLSNLEDGTVIGTGSGVFYDGLGEFDPDTNPDSNTLVAVQVTFNEGASDPSTWRGVFAITESNNPEYPVDSFFGGMEIDIATGEMTIQYIGDGDEDDITLGYSSSLTLTGIWMNQGPGTVDFTADFVNNTPGETDTDFQSITINAGNFDPQADLMLGNYTEYVPADFIFEISQGGDEFEVNVIEIGFAPSNFSCTGLADGAVIGSGVFENLDFETVDVEVTFDESTSTPSLGICNGIVTITASELDEYPVGESYGGISIDNTGGLITVQYIGGDDDIITAGYTSMLTLNDNIWTNPAAYQDVDAEFHFFNTFPGYDAIATDSEDIVAAVFSPQFAYDAGTMVGGDVVDFNFEGSLGEGEVNISGIEIVTGPGFDLSATLLDQVIATGTATIGDDPLPVEVVITERLSDISIEGVLQVTDSGLFIGNVNFNSVTGTISITDIDTGEGYMTEGLTINVTIDSAVVPFTLPAPGEYEITAEFQSVLPEVSSIVTVDFDVTDCAGIVGGSNVTDIMGACCSQLHAYYVDSDSDTYGSGDSVMLCEAPEGYVDRGGDCNDDNDEIYPGAEEICDGEDSNCDGVTPATEIQDGCGVWCGDSDCLRPQAQDITLSAIEGVQVVFDNMAQYYPLPEDAPDEVDGPYFQILTSNFPENIVDYIYYDHNTDQLFLTIADGWANDYSFMFRARTMDPVLGTWVNSGIHRVTVEVEFQDDAPVVRQNYFLSAPEHATDLYFAITALDDGPDNELLIVIDDSELLGSVVADGRAFNEYNYSTDGAFDYLAEGETASDVLSYTVYDHNGGEGANSTAGEVTFVITGENSAPIADAIAVIDNNFTEDFETVNIPIAATGVYDIDGPNNQLRFIGFAAPYLSGTVSIAPTGTSLVYSPNGEFEYLAEGEQVSDQVTVIVADDLGAGATVTFDLDIVINGVNDAPQGVQDAAVITEGSEFPVVIEVLANDTDVDNLSFLELGTTPISQEVIDDVDGSLIAAQPELDCLYNGDIVECNYAPGFESLNQGEVAVVEITYALTDGIDESFGTILMEVNGVNNAPIALGEVNEMDPNDIIDFDGISFDMSDNLISGSGLTCEEMIDAGQVIFYNASFIPGNASDGTTGIRGAEITYDGACGFTIDYPDAVTINDIPAFDAFLFMIDDGSLSSNVRFMAFAFSESGLRELRAAPIAMDQELTMLEDYTLDITFVGMDMSVDFTADNAHIDIMVPPSHGSLDGDPVLETTQNFLATWTASYTPDENFNGVDIIEYRVYNTDNLDGFSANATVTITVNPVNDAPVMDAILSQEIDEGIEFLLTVSATDVDTDDVLTYSLIQGIGAMEINGSTGEISGFVPDDAEIGTHLITVRADDIAGAWDQTQFNLTVNNVNDIPVIIGQVALSTPEETAITLELGDIIVTDEDGSYPDGYVLNVGAGDNYSVEDLTVTPDFEFNGDLTVPVTVNDGVREESDPFDLIITVTAVNDLPTFTLSTPDAVEEDGENIIIDFTPMDNDDGEVLTAVAEVSNEVLFPEGSYSIDITEDVSGVLRTLTLDPADERSGTSIVMVTVSDGVNDVVKQVEVTVTEVNDPPVLAEIGNQIMSEDTELTILLDAVDPEGSDIEYSVTEGINVTANLVDNQLTFAPDEDFFGNDVFTVTVSDGVNIDFEVFTLTVVNVNDAPVITSTAGLEAWTEVEWTYQVVVDDPDAETLNYSLEGAPEGMVIDENGLITWTPALGTLSSGSVTLTVDDGEFSDIEVFNVNNIHQVDCNGVADGTAFIDECGDCVGGDTGLDPCEQDCNGVWGGTAYLDNCGICVGGDTGLVECEQDCNGEWGGSAEVDVCGVCAGGSTGLIPDADLDCNNECFGTAFIDDCGICVGGSTGLEACTCVSGFGTFYEDADNDGLGDPAVSQEFCLDDPITGWVENSDDLCPNDALNDADGDGVCGDVDICEGGDDNDDNDADGIPDFCDDNDDLDSYLDVDDNCPFITNEDQADFDGDGQGDVCDNDDDDDGSLDINDVCPFDADNDIDGDGFCANEDNCPDTYNPDQADFDFDGIGDVCDIQTYGTVTVEFGDIDNTQPDFAYIDVDYDADVQIRSFNFNIDGVNLDADNSVSDMPTLNVNPTYGYVIGFTVEDQFLPSGTGTLVTLAVPYDYIDGVESCLTNVHITAAPTERNVPLIIVGECTNIYLPEQDCWGDYNGDAFLDDCGICSGGNSGHEANSDIDACGLCPDDEFYGNVVDEFGFVTGDAADCAGVCFGSAAIDDCGYCAGGTTGLPVNFADQGCGCDVPGPVEHCEDYDQDGLGADPEVHIIQPHEFCLEMGDILTDNTTHGLATGIFIPDCTDPHDDGEADVFITDVVTTTLGSGSLVLAYNSDVPIYQFMIELSGITIIDVASANPEFVVNYNATSGEIQGFSYTGFTLPPVLPDAGYGELFYITFAYDFSPSTTACISDYIVSGAPARELFVYIGECVEIAEPYADCAGVYNGDAVENEYFEDLDSDGLGGLSLGIHCSAFADPDWVLNGDDLHDDIYCESNTFDCALVCDGEAFIDNCGVCSGGTTGHVADSDIDCAGECFGEAVIDECGVCCDGVTGVECSYYVDSSDFGGAYDCAGDCAGEALIDICGGCYGGNSGNEIYYLDLGCGCNVDGPVNHYYDEDIDGLGDFEGIPVDYCVELGIETDNTTYELPLENWVTNNDDICPLDPQNDRDHDNVCGDVDNCPLTPNEDQLDSDGDLQGDVCDECPFDEFNDVDGDDICGDVDNCPETPNHDQFDEDGDDIGDVCDECPFDPDNDIDEDGYCADVDNCPTDFNDDQLDSDGDLIGDVCDDCPFDPDNDADLDGYCADVDNCPELYNANQSNWDGVELTGEILGDVCDPTPWGDVILSWGIIETEDGEGSAEIYYESNIPVAGFQFAMSGAYLLAGTSPLGGFGVSVEPSTGGVVGISVIGDTYPAGTGLLTTLTFDIDETFPVNGDVETCLSDFVFSESFGLPLGVIGPDCETLVDPTPVGEVTLSFGDVDDTIIGETGTVTFEYETDVDLYGFQFTVSGIELVAGSADSENPNIMWDVNPDNGNVVGVSLSGDFYPAGSGSLVTFDYYYAPDVSACLSDAIVSGVPGEAPEVTLGPCVEFIEPETDCFGVYNAPTDIEFYIGEVDECEGTMSIMYNSAFDMHGFSFTMDTITPLTAIDGDLEVSITGNTVYGFTYVGDVIPAAENAVLVTLTFEPFSGGVPVCLSDQIASYQFNQMCVDIIDGCYDLMAIEQDCMDEWCGEAFVDDCGYCVGGNTGLEENFMDLGCGCEVPGPEEYCFDFDGDGSGALGDWTTYCTEMGTETDNTIYELVPEGYLLDCTDATDEGDVYLTIDNVDNTAIGSSGTFNILYDSNVDIYGAQFTITGVTALSVFTDNPDFAVSVNPDNGAVVVMSFSGAFYAEGMGTLITVTYEYGPTADICLEGLVVAGFPETVPFAYDVACVEAVEPPTDCNNEYNGLAEVDVCGNCWGGSTGIDEPEVPLTYYYDFDGDGLGDPNESDEFCLADVPIDYVSNSDDDYPFGFVELTYENIVNDLDYTTGSFEIYYSSEVDLYGFQMNISGIEVLSAESPIDGFQISVNSENGQVVGISFSGTYYPEGTDLMLASFTYTLAPQIESCLTDIIFSGAPEDPAPDVMGECAEFTEPPVDCFGTYNGEAFTDDCGYCVGGLSGLDANYMDLGCGCDAPAPVEYCYDYDGDGFGAVDSEMLYCSEMGETTTDNTMYTLVPEDYVLDCSDESDEGDVYLSIENLDNTIIGESGTFNIMYNANIDLYGAQFVISGVTVESVSTDNPDFMASLNPDNGYVLLMSFSGGVYPEGVGTLLNVTYSYGPTADICIVDIIPAGPAGIAPTAHEVPCVEAVEPPMDCNNEYNGLAEVDECGNCWGGSTGILEPEFPMVYYFDFDGDGLGDPNESEMFCLAEIEPGYVTNSDDDHPFGFVELTYENIVNDLDYTTGSFEIYYSSEVDLYGFQMNISGIEVLSAESPIDGFQISVNSENGQVVGISFSGTYYPEGTDLMLASFTYTLAPQIESCLTDIIFSGAPEDPAPDVMGECAVFTEPPVDCYGTYNGEAFTDDCGYCVGGLSGLEANYMDLGCGCDVPAPIEYCIDVDEDGFGAVGSETTYCAEMGLVTENTTGELVPDGWVEDCTDEYDEGDVYLTIDNIDNTIIGTSGTFDILYDTNVDIYGAQFTVSGVTVLSATTDNADFSVSVNPENGTIVLLSLTGGFYETGVGTLMTVTYEYGPTADICIENIIPAGYPGTAPFAHEVACAEAVEPPVDCNNEYNGLAEIDVCGNCWGGSTGIDEPEVPMTYYFDYDGDGLGDPDDSEEFCLAEVLPGYVTNSDDEYPFGEVYLTYENIAIDQDSMYGTFDIYYSSDVDIYGFQFNVSEIELVEALSPVENFSITVEGSNGNVVGLSFTGDYYETGENLLLGSFTYMLAPEVTSCITALIISSSPGDPAPAAFAEDCALFMEPEVDCADVYNGEAFIDDCGVCSGGTTGHEANSDMDDCGVCFGNNECFGCTDPEALNYDPDATIDDGSCQYGYDITLHDGSNLMSFYGLPEDASLANVLAPLEGNAFGVIGEGQASQPHPSYPSIWVGSLTEFDLTSGYWLKLNESTVFEVPAMINEEVVIYDLHDGSNLISYPFPGSQSISDALPVELDDIVLGIIGEGTAAIPHPLIPGEWIGSLIALEGGEGYWMKLSEAAVFSYNEPDALVKAEMTVQQPVPDAFSYTQSSEQAFYFVEEVNIDGESMSEGDLILVYNNDVLVGARVWNGSVIDVPAMGYDGERYSEGFCQAGDVPQFKVYQSSTGDIIELAGDITGWSSNGLFSVTNLTSVVDVPEVFELLSAYPNPFNPVTNVKYALPDEAEVSITVYDMTGRMVSELVNEVQPQGYHHIAWNASEQASGIYFIRVTVGSETQIQKVMLVK